MKFFINAFFVLAIIFASCNPFSGPAFPEPRNVEWKKVWEKNQAKLKALTQDILVKENKKYTAGINDFPSGFDYPFDDGFFIETPFPNNETDGFDAKK